MFKVSCLQVCPWFLWSHDCPKSPLCITDANTSNDPIGFGHTTLDLLNQGRNHCTLGFIPPPPGAVPQPQRAGWAGWTCLGDVLGWTGRGLGHSKSRCPFPSASGASGWAQSSTLQGCPRSAVWSQAEQVNTDSFLLTLPRYQTCWQLVSRQKRRKGKQTRRKKVLLVSAPHKKYQGRSTWIETWGQKKPSTCFPT